MGVARPGAAAQLRSRRVSTTCNALVHHAGPISTKYGEGHAQKEALLNMFDVESIASSPKGCSTTKLPCGPINMTLFRLLESIVLS